MRPLICTLMVCLPLLALPRTNSAWASVSAARLLYPPITTFEQDTFKEQLGNTKLIASWHPAALFAYSDDLGESYAPYYAVAMFNSTDDARQFNAADYVSPWKRVSTPLRQAPRLTPQERVWV